MKKDYNAPQISVMSIEVEQGFLTLSVTGNSHEGFVEVTDPNLKIEDGTNDDSAFKAFDTIVSRITKTNTV